jgi:hypothetical protein
MIDLVRFLFGWAKPAHSRTVLGQPGPVDSREVAYIRDSNTRLSTLFQLGNRFKDTPYAPKVRSVYEKTKTIHSFLVARKRIMELELFHIQNTDHFINTFTVILDAHQKASQIPLPAGPVSGRAEKGKTQPRPGPLRDGQQPDSHTNGQVLAVPALYGHQIPRLTAPTIRINPTARILYYVQDPTPEGLTTREIGLTSPEEEKASFLAHVAARFGIANIVYLGNALVNIPDTTSPTPTGLVAVIHWQGHPYGVNFTDGRLFPVKMPA